MPQKITVREVGLRDGLQSIQTIVATRHKLAWISAAYAARATGFLWWVAPFHKPRNLGERLLQAGIRFEGTAPAMAMDLADLPRDEAVPEGLEIVPVRTLEEALAAIE